MTRLALLLALLAGGCASAVAPADAAALRALVRCVQPADGGACE